MPFDAPLILLMEALSLLMPLQREFLGRREVGGLGSIPASTMLISSFFGVLTRLKIPPD